MIPIIALSFTEIVVGQTAEFSVKITEQAVEDFSRLSGDRNPLHMDESYANKTSFKGRVVHGQLGVSYFSRLVGMYLPGRYALYLKQTASFRAPIRIGMDILVHGSVSHKTEANQTLILETQILNKEDSAVLIDGQAIVKVLE